MKLDIQTDGWTEIGPAPFIIQQFSGRTLHMQPAAATPPTSDKGEGSLRIQDHTERNVTMPGTWYGRFDPVEGPATTYPAIVIAPL